MDQQHSIGVFYHSQLLPHVLSIRPGREANLLLFEVVQALYPSKQLIFPLIIATIEEKAQAV